MVKTAEEIKQEKRKVALNENLEKLPDFYAHILKLATGFGKTYLALSMSKQHGGRWLVVCWELAHIKEWKLEIVKHGFNINNYDFVTYMSFTKIKSEVEGVIFDEAHHFKENHAFHMIDKTVNPMKVLFLSATIPSERIKVIKWFIEYAPNSKSKDDFRVQKRTLSQSIASNVLPEPTVNVIYTYLNNIEPNQILEIKKGGVKAKTILEGKYADRFKLMKGRKEYILKLKATEKEVYEYYDSQFNYWWQKFIVSREEYMKNLALQNANKRKRFLSQSKTKSIKDLLNSHINVQPNSRSVIFTGSVAQCTELGGNDAIHSKKTAKQVSNIIDSFNNQERDKLFAVGMIREGKNLVNTPYGVIGQLDNQSKSYTQMVGRLLRHENPVIFVIVVKDTQDEKYLKTAIDGFNKDYISTYTLPEFLTLNKVA